MQTDDQEDLTGLASIEYQYPKRFKADGLPEALSPNQLIDARVIGQTDAKFITFIVSVPQTDGNQATEKSMIVVADQHAVDERILLEKMLKSVLGPVRPPDPAQYSSPANSILLSPPRKIELSRSEAVKAMKYRSIFNKWSIDFTSFQEPRLSHENNEQSSGTESKHFHELHSASKYFGKRPPMPSETSSIQVTRIPRVISDRCASNPELLKLVICDHIEWIESQSTNQQVETHEQEEADFSDWGRYLRDCPRGIIEILKSKSCRSAIMFNDVLTHQQCQKLIDLVSECVHPFQCAHGRYSF